MPAKNSFDFEKTVRTYINEISYKHKISKQKDPYAESFMFILDHLFNDIRIVDALSKIKDESFCMLLDDLKFKLHEENAVPVTVLNIGSGEGVLSKNVVEISEDIILIDLDMSLDMLLTFDKSYRVMANAIKLPFKKDSIDIVISHSTLRYIPRFDYRLLIEELIRVIKCNGSLIFSETIEQVSHIFYKELQKSGLRPSIETRKYTMFRCSTFYLIFKEYNLNYTFRSGVNLMAKHKKKELIDILIDLAGFKQDNIYLIKSVVF